MQKEKKLKQPFNDKPLLIKHDNNKKLKKKHIVNYTYLGLYKRDTPFNKIILKDKDNTRDKHFYEQDLQSQIAW